MRALQESGISAVRACALVGYTRSNLYYQRVRKDEDVIAKRLELAYPPGVVDRTDTRSEGEAAVDRSGHVVLGRLDGIRHVQPHREVRRDRRRQRAAGAVGVPASDPAA